MLLLLLIQLILSFPRKRESSQLTAILFITTGDEEDLFLLDPRFHGDDGVVDSDAALTRDSFALVGAVTRGAS